MTRRASSTSSEMLDLQQISDHLPPPPLDGSTIQCSYIQGSALYYHYGCDGVDDRGWGCGYRSLQTLCSWVCGIPDVSNLTASAVTDATDSASGVTDSVPSLQKIQDTLVHIGDKPSTFLNSKTWIGAAEVAMCIDQLYQVPCKIIHVPSGTLHQHVENVITHLNTIGSPIMMGGDSDASSKAIFGACKTDENKTYLLIVDPHYYGASCDFPTLISSQWITWRELETFDHNSFYNLCLPQGHYQHPS